ncbi:hypothetical protein ND861_09955 [Leptospira sp. 2 VSF19]|uniref:Lipoprotein n=1 Tax=Leptospira soteropolitanensis TaxID=2950025 RepID=A0AAW5VHB5_9LEPT|nr:hypothetical protein [Leptospira soteropolitanensis]MCW7492469.1 hypothetical protein [Leptospira soteropolitanensis]MCW7500519.1 hypothetical protein [Leptospira soteropolitanensis]MCW7522811.1 hypothetical protein [Leptospira soteropolitanensis]MCW7526669.1 hypothetical protein [Leptospira soteropolitanensis]MCW7530489.1 hypothetical protein [Leptospira soteropolitanensis]
MFASDNSILSRFNYIRVFLVAVILIFSPHCTKYYVYPNHFSDPEPVSKSTLTEVRVSNFRILSIDENEFEEKLQDYGFSLGMIGIGKVDGKSKFYITPGKHRFRLAYFDVRIHNYAKNRVIDTYSSNETATLEVDLKAGQQVCICFQNLTPENFDEFTIVAGAREYKDQREFQPPVYIPYISKLNFLPGDCGGGDGKNAFSLNKSNQIIVKKSIDSRNKANIVTY